MSCRLVKQLFLPQVMNNITGNRRIHSFKLSFKRLSSPTLFSLSNYQYLLLNLIENENNVGELNRLKDSLKECIRRFPVILFITWGRKSCLTNLQLKDVHSTPQSSKTIYFKLTFVIVLIVLHLLFWVLSHYSPLDYNGTSISRCTRWFSHPRSPTYLRQKVFSKSQSYN